MTNADKYLIVVGGPTAVGKTNLAIQLAQHFNTEILSADSRQFYKEISIGTAKPSIEELAAAPHHFIDSHPITKEFNAGQFEKAALSILEKLFQKHHIAIAVGGSGLYINALCQGLDDIPNKDPNIRVHLQTVYETEGIIALQKQLEDLDPHYYAVVDRQNPQRLMRALEVCISSGMPYSSFRKQQLQNRPFKIIKIGLNLPREQLYAQINTRVDIMMQAGLLEEAKAMHPYKHLNALQTVGYAELFDYFEGIHTLEKAVELIKQHTRNFAKRQLTWFNRDTEMLWFSPFEQEAILQHIQTQIADEMA